MSVKTVLKLFVPPIYYKIKYGIYNGFGTKKGKFKSTIGDISKQSEKLIVIGNGPSLNDTLKNSKDIILENDCVVVNHFCETEYYQQLKPGYYLLADPNFFGDIDKYADWQKKRVRGFIEKLISNTKWDIKLIVPSFAIGSELITRIRDNKFIHPYYYNNTDVKKYNKEDKSERFKCYDKNVIGIPSQTVLNTSIWLGIFLRYKEIYIVGADTNWIESLHVDQDTNELFTIDKHFYGEVKRPIFKDVEGKETVKLHEELLSNYFALKSYWDLKEYASYANVNVYNASEYSLIDAFERKKLV